MVWCGVVYDFVCMVWYGKVWYGMEWYVYRALLYKMLRGESVVMYGFCATERALALSPPLEHNKLFTC